MRFRVKERAKTKARGKRKERETNARARESKSEGSSYREDRRTESRQPRKRGKSYGGIPKETEHKSRETTTTKPTDPKNERRVLPRSQRCPSLPSHPKLLLPLLYSLAPKAFANPNKTPTPLATTPNPPANPVPLKLFTQNPPSPPPT